MGLGAGLPGAGGHGVAVGVADLAGAGHLGGRHELAARGNDGHARSAVDGHLQHAATGQKADAGGGEHIARLHDHVPRMGFLAGGANVGVHFRRGRERHHRAGFAVAFHHAHDLVLHHGIGVGRQAGAGHDAHALAFPDGSLEHVAGTDFGDDPQHRGALLGGIGDLGGAQGEAVHGRVREGRHVDVACLVGRHHTPDSVQQLHRFHGQLLHSPAHERTGLF